MSRKKRAIIIPAMLCLCLAAYSAAAQQTKPRILVFNLSLYEQTKNELPPADKEERPDGKKKPARMAPAANRKPLYLQQILAQAIAGSLEATGRFTVQRTNDVLPDIGPDGTAAFTDALVKIGEERDVDIVVGGKYGVMGKKMVIDLRIVTVKTGKLEFITKERAQIAAEMTALIDDLSAEIDRRFGSMDSRKDGTEVKPRPGPDKKSEVKPEPPADPSAKTPYYPMKGFMLGVTVGTYFIQGKWKDVFPNTEYITPSIGYQILPWLTATAEADYIAAHNKSRVPGTYRTLVLWGLSANAGFHIPVNQYFLAGFVVGPGASFTTIKQYDTNTPIMLARPASRTSMDPLLNIAIQGTVRISPLQFTFGTAFKGIFYRDKPLILATLFAGVGIRL